MSKHQHGPTCLVCSGQARTQTEKRVVGQTTGGKPVEATFTRQICAGQKQADCTWASAWESPALEALREQARQGTITLRAEYADARRPVFSRDDANRLIDAEAAAYAAYQATRQRPDRQTAIIREARDAWETAKRALQQAQTEYPAQFPAEQTGQFAPALGGVR